MRTAVIAVYLLLAYAAVHHGHAWHLLPLNIMALGAWTMAYADGRGNTDAQLEGAIVGFPIFCLGLLIELFFVIDWLLF